MAYKQIGIFGGTFDPIHFGHLRSALEIKQAFNMDEMRLIPCNEPPHRKAPIATAADRLKLLELALANTELQLDTIEMQRSGPSYTIDTVDILRNSNPDASLSLVLGLDAFLNLPTWHKWEQLIEKVNMIVMLPEQDHIVHAHALQDYMKAHALPDNKTLADFRSGKICTQKITGLAISGSLLRHLLLQGHSIQFLVPDAVLKYIQTHQLYGYKRENHA